MSNFFDVELAPSETPIANTVAADASPAPTGGNFFDNSVPETTQQAELESGAWYEDPIMAARMALDGMTVGWGDEAGSAVAAAAAKIMGDEKPYADIYADIKGTVDMQAEEYSEEHPVATAALQIGGAVASPVNWVAPGSGSVRNITRAGAEGFAYGAGSSKDGERLSGGSEGAAWGLALGVPLQIAGKAFSGATKRRVAQELGEGDEFIPMTQAASVADSVVPNTPTQVLGQEAAEAAESVGKKTTQAVDGNANVGGSYESFLGTFYRDIVGQTFGGHGRVVAQEDRIINPLIRLQEVTKEAYDKTVRNASEAVARGKQTIKGKTDEGVAAAKARMADATEDAQLSRSQIAEKASDTKATAILTATKNVDEATVSAEKAFRGQGYSGAIPDGASADEIAYVMGAPNGNVAMSRVEELWSSIGFDMLDNRKFQINPTRVANEVEKRIKDSPLLSLAGMSNSEVQKTMDIMTEFITDKTAKGWIDGKDFSAIRSSLGTLAASKSDAGGNPVVMQTVYREMQDVLNGMLETQLSGKNLKKFKLHKDQWKQQSVLRDAVTSASKKAGRMGDYSPDEWVQAVARNSPRDARRGQGPLRKEADRVAELGVQRDKTITEGAEAVVKQAEKTKLTNLRRTNSELAKAKRELVNETAELQRSGRASVAKMERVQSNKSKIAAMEQQQTQIQNQIDSLKDVGTQRNPRIFQRMFASGILGHGYGLANLASGTALGNILGTQGAQRALAGQTGFQKGAQNFIQRAAPAAQGAQAGLAGYAGSQ